MKPQIFLAAAAFAVMGSPALAQDQAAPEADTTAEASAETSIDAAAAAEAELAAPEAAMTKDANVDARSVKSEKKKHDCADKKKEVTT